jgi:hypothetical protein
MFNFGGDGQSLKTDEEHLPDLSTQSQRLILESNTFAFQGPVHRFHLRFS